MDRMSRLVLRVVVAGYLIYLAYSLVTGQLAGDSGMSDLLAYGSAAAMGLGGLAFLGYTLKEYFCDDKKEAPPEDPEAPSPEE